MHTCVRVRACVRACALAFVHVHGCACVWHEHGHDGTEPVIWLDVLDLPLIYYTETSYHINGDKQDVSSAQSGTDYAVGSVVPMHVFEATAADNAHRDSPLASYPILRYPWAVARDTLLALAQSAPDQRCCRWSIPTRRREAMHKTYWASTR